MAVSDIEKAYAAGLIDGEGCIDIGVNHPKKGSRSRDQLYVRVGIHMTNPLPLEEFKNIWGGSIHIRKPFINHWKQSYDWKVTCGSAMEFLADIEPFLIVKKAEARVALEFKVRTGQEKRLTDEEVGARKSIKEKLHELKSIEFPQREASSGSHS
jgi:hypothetical protein